MSVKNLKQDLELLYELQVYDIEIEDLKKQVTQVSSLIDEKKESLEIEKSEINVKKKLFVELNFLKREKDFLLDAKERMIGKHSTELNTLKSNYAYKMLFLEIEKEKADKNAIEDELLDIMDKIDHESFVAKIADEELKKFENKIKNDIKEIESFGRTLKEKIVKTEKQREEHRLKVNRKILLQYERLRNVRYGYGIVLVESESCGACGMMLRPQMINQAQKGYDIVFCDNCSRILLKR